MVIVVLMLLRGIRNWATEEESGERSGKENQKWKGLSQDESSPPSKKGHSSLHSFFVDIIVVVI